MSRFQLSQFHGVSPVLYAFWNVSGGLDHGAMRHQVERCIAAGAHGITVLGLITEINRMNRDERLELVRVVGAAVDGRVPYSVTIGEPDIAGQQRFISEAVQAGADWAILQPPLVKGLPAESISSFFEDVASCSPVPVAIQNNPVNLDVWLSNADLACLVERAEAINLIKGEGSALQVGALAGLLGGNVPIFAGQGGVEFPLELEGGCAGLIPAPELLDRQVEIYETYRAGNVEQASRQHAEILPWIVMVTRTGIEGMLCYGKRLMARRIGLAEPTQRAPALAPTTLGLRQVDRMFDRLGPL